MNAATPALSRECGSCPVHNLGNLAKLGVEMSDANYVVALAGNPNTGKSTVFNALTGLRQHTGNWPGKTVARAEGGFKYRDERYKLVDLPGTYSLLATSLDEEIARDFILFAQPDVTVVVVDATRIESNLNLVLQILEITDRVVVCLNLVDQAKRLGIDVDERTLARDLGVPVVATSARYGEGLEQLVQVMSEVACGQVQCKPHRIRTTSPALQQVLKTFVPRIERAFPGLPNARWVALQLLDGDQRIREAVSSGELGTIQAGEKGPQVEEHPEPSKAVSGNPHPPKEVREILELAESWRWREGEDFQQQLLESIYGEAARIRARSVHSEESPRQASLDRTIDRIVTSRIWGFPLMVLLLTVVFWITISGANYPSSLLATLLLDDVHPFLKHLASGLGVPWWIDGLLIDGMYLATAWVVSVMLPPMAIFFPLFTLLEDFGYLPRVAFNLDQMFRKVGGHGKQALSLAMGFGCNAAGVISTRIIDSPRERLIAIITNNFALCNGRWPTQILIATLFLGALAPAHLAGLVSALSVVSIAVLGVLLTFAVSWLLSRTILRGEVSTFSLELPPYRPPRILSTIYTSLIDRTIYVLWRAIVFALPAGAVIWLSSNIQIGGESLAVHAIDWLNPFGLFIGLNGVILLAYIVAIPANEIVIPTILMLTVLSTGLTGIGGGSGVIFELNDQSGIMSVFQAGGWTLLTGINLMLFSLIHNPCSTTIYTIYKETHSAKWTAIASLLPVALGILVVFLVTQFWQLLG